MSVSIDGVIKNLIEVNLNDTNNFCTLMTYETKFKNLTFFSGNLKSPEYAVVFQILLRRPLIFQEQISHS